MAEFVGFSGFIPDLLVELTKIVTKLTTFFIKTIAKGFTQFLFDTLRYLEQFINHIEHLIKR